jgi:hypothetical protein
MTQCPLLQKCFVATGMDCKDRNYDGKQTTSDARWLKKEPCRFYENLVKERTHKPKLQQNKKKHLNFKHHII